MAEGTLTRGLSYGTLTFGLTSALTVVSSILTARLFGIEVVGQFALVMAPATAVSLLSTIREQPALVRRLAGTTPGDPLITGLFGAVFVFSVALTFATVLVATGATWFLFHGPINHPALFLPAVAGLVGYAVISNTAWNFDYLFTAFMASGPLFRVRMCQAVLFPVLVAALSFVRSDVWSLVVAFYGSWAVSTVYRLWIARTIMPYRLTPAARRQGRTELPGILKFGLRIMPGYLAIGASGQAGTWILGATTSVASVGAFNRASTVTGKFGDLNFRITEMLFPALVTRRHKGETAGFDRAVVDTLRYSVIGLVAPAAILGGTSSGILALFGPGFQRAATALPLLAVVPAAISATAVLANTMFALNRTNATTAIAIVRLLVTAGGGVVLTAAYGLDGMAAAIALGAVAQFIAQAVVTLPQLSTPVRRLWPWRQAVGIVAAYLSGFAAARAVDVAMPGLVGLLLALAAGSVAYAATLLAVGGLIERDRDRLKMIRTRLNTDLARPAASRSVTGVASRARTTRTGGGVLTVLKNIASSFVTPLMVAGLTGVLTVLLVRPLGAVRWGVVALVLGMSLVALAVSNAVAARLTKTWEDKPNAQTLQGALRGLIAFQCLALGPAVVWATPIARVLLGPGQASSADVLTAAAPFIFFCGLEPLAISAVRYAGEAGLRVPITLATLALTAAGAVILIPNHGVLGAALAADIALGFYTLAHVWLCRWLFKLDIPKLVWSVACGLTAAAAMGIVLASVGTKNLVILDWLKGGVGGLAAYLLMLIFTREVSTADITRASATIGARGPRVHLTAGRRRSTGSATLPRRQGPVASSGRNGSLVEDAASTPLSSTAAAESSDLAPAGASASTPHVGSPTGVSIPNRNVPRLRDRLAAAAHTTRRVLPAVVSSRRRHSALARPAPPARPGLMASDMSRGHRSPAARPPAWIEGLAPEPAELSTLLGSPAADPPSWLTSLPTGRTATRHRQAGEELTEGPVPSQEVGGPPSGDGADAVLRDPRHRDPFAPAPLPDARDDGTSAADDAKNGTSAGGDAKNGTRAGGAAEVHGRQLPSAAQPPPWLSNSSGQAGVSSAIVGNPDRSNPFVASRTTRETRADRSDTVYQIGWRLDKDAGVFELRAVEPWDASEASGVEESPPVSWGWRMAPAPIPEARDAHAALVDRLLAAGWRRAGSGDTWFGHRFQSPRRPLPDEGASRAVN